MATSCDISSRIVGSTSHVSGRTCFSMNPYGMSWASLLHVFIKSLAKKMMKWPPLPPDNGHRPCYSVLVIQEEASMDSTWSSGSDHGACNKSGSFVSQDLAPSGEEADCFPSLCLFLKNSSFLHGESMEFDGEDEKTI